MSRHFYNISKQIISTVARSAKSFVCFDRFNIAPGISWGQYISDNCSDMLTKKEKLLSQPWIVQKFQSHRRKVQSAGPAIDFRPPSSHPHVIVKLKKTQRECERLNEIQRENRRLLQRLGQIMNTRRLENFWQYSRPNFLNRERLYVKKKRPNTALPTNKTDDGTSGLMSSKETTLTGIRGQSARCMVCSGRYVKKNQVIPEERVPWAGPKTSWNKKLNERKTPVHKLLLLNFY